MFWVGLFVGILLTLILLAIVCVIVYYQQKKKMKEIEKMINSGNEFFERLKNN